MLGAGRLNCLNIRQVIRRGSVLSVHRCSRLHELMLRNRKSMAKVDLAEQTRRELTIRSSSVCHQHTFPSGSHDVSSQLSSSYCLFRLSLVSLEARRDGRIWQFERVEIHLLIALGGILGFSSCVALALQNFTSTCER